MESNPVPDAPETSAHFLRIQKALENTIAILYIYTSLADTPHRTHNR
jgi:hypothetical protein